MWMRKSMMLVMMIIVTSAHGFGSSDLKELEPLFHEHMETIAIEMKEMSRDGEQKGEARGQDGSMLEMARALLSMLMD
jgi:hypothetical protein